MFSSKLCAVVFTITPQIFEQQNLRLDLKPTLSKELHRKVRRPDCSVLDNSRADRVLGIDLSHLKAGLLACLKERKVP